MQVPSRPWPTRSEASLAGWPNAQIPGILVPRAFPRPGCEHANLDQGTLEVGSCGDGSDRQTECQEKQRKIRK